MKKAKVEEKPEIWEVLIDGVVVCEATRTPIKTSYGAIVGYETKFTKSINVKAKENLTLRKKGGK